MPNETQLTQARTETQDRQSRRTGPQQEGTVGPANDEGSVEREASDDSVIAILRLPAAARGAFGGRGLGALYGIVLLSIVDGSLLALGQAGAFDSVGSALAVGLTVLAGAGSWMAAQSSFAGRRRTRADAAALTVLGALMAVGAVGSAWLALQAGSFELQVLPQLAGWIILLVAGDVAGLPLPRVGSVPLPAATAAAGAVAEGARWIPS